MYKKWHVDSVNMKNGVTVYVYFLIVLCCCYLSLDQVQLVGCMRKSPGDVEVKLCLNRANWSGASMSVVDGMQSSLYA